MNFIFFIINFLLLICVIESNNNIFAQNGGGILNTTMYECLLKENGVVSIIGTDCQSMINSVSAGYKPAYVIAYPNPNGETATQMLSNIVSRYNECKTSWNGFIWIDVYSTAVWGTPWTPAGYIDHKNYLTEAVNYCVSNKLKCGIKATSSSYQAIFNDIGFNVAAKNGLPLYSLGYIPDPQPPEFGGWTVPAEIIIGNTIKPNTYPSCYMTYSFNVDVLVN